MRARTACLALLAALALAGACSFPTVEFSDAEPDAGAGGACSLPAGCSSKAQSCAADARNAEDCSKKCKTPTSNPCTDCKAALQALLDACVSQCTSCAQAGACGGAKCRDLVGAP